MSFTQLGWALKKNKFVLTMCEYTLRAFRLNEWCPVFGEHEVKMAASWNVGKDFYVHECFSLSWICAATLTWNVSKVVAIQEVTWRIFIEVSAELSSKFMISYKRWTFR